MTRLENAQWEREHANDPSYFEVLHFANFGVALGRIITAMPIQQGWAACLRLLMVMVDSIPDDKWKELMKTCRMPCERPNCNCEVLGTKAYETLDRMRTEYRSYKEENNNEY
jgi:hypothetical protein